MTGRAALTRDRCLVAVVVIVVGRVGRMWPVAIVGYVVLALAALMFLVGRL